MLTSYPFRVNRRFLTEQYLGIYDKLYIYIYLNISAENEQVSRKISNKIHSNNNFN